MTATATPPAPKTPAASAPKGPAAIATPPAAATTPINSADLRAIPLKEIRESPHNPRRTIDAKKLEEMAASIREHGILTPLLARPVATAGTKPGHYELAAGHRRFRAATIVGLATVPVVVREMTDLQFLEVVNIENEQREDLHPLDKAVGYAALLKTGNYDVAKLADRLGRSHTYVRDHLRLLDLSKPIQQLFLGGEITLGHAIIIARLTSDDQQRLYDPGEAKKFGAANGALFVPDTGHQTEELAIADQRKPISVRELQAWVDDHIRFDEAAKDVPDLFPETAKVLSEAEAVEEKVVKITHEHFIQPEARAEDERTIGPRSWHRADGQAGSKTCEYSVVGVVAVGEGRGEAFRVCTNKKKCKTHWATEIREAAKRSAQSGGGDGPSKSGPSEHDKVRARQLAEQQRADAARAAFAAAIPTIMGAVAPKLAKLPASGTSAAGKYLIDCHIPGFKQPEFKKLLDAAPKAKTAEEVIRLCLYIQMARAATEWDAVRILPAALKQLGIDPKPLIDAALQPASTPTPPAATPAKKAAKKPTAARKGGKKKK